MDQSNYPDAQFDLSVLDGIEKTIYRLRSLYMSCGYGKYRMSKFEEYDLYVRNKDYLVSDSIITFTDTTGKLMALKPDVTLSIIKNTKDNPEGLQKLCYNENVYRVSKSTESFKEIMQAGLECIGNIDDACIGEIILLAAKSLELIKPDYIIETAQLDVLSAFLDELTDDKSVRRLLLKCISEKNLHGITSICREHQLPEKAEEDLRSLISLYGAPAVVIPGLRSLCEGKTCMSAVDSMVSSLSIPAIEGYEDHIIIDFSVVSDLKYYNGMIFKGFLRGIPGSVLSGGQYDNLMKRMGKRSGAIGFAVYLDVLDGCLD